jgi:general secretion pathway protein L
MTVLREIAEVFSRWLDAVAAAIVAVFGWFISPRVVQIVEEQDGTTFTVRVPKDEGTQAERIQLGETGAVGTIPAAVLKAVRGNRVEVVLRPSRFVVRQLELPRRAVEYLDGIIRAQIDRLTPWPAADAVFGWGRPEDIANDRISITIAATARAMVRPILQAVSELGAASIALVTVPVEGSAGVASIKVYDQSIRGMLDPRRVRRILLVVLLVAGAAAGLSIAADVTVGSSLEAQQLDLGRRLAPDRTVSLAAPPPSSTGASRRPPRPSSWSRR